MYVVFQQQDSIFSLSFSCSRQVGVISAGSEAVGQREFATVMYKYIYILPSKNVGTLSFLGRTKQQTAKEDSCKARKIQGLFIVIAYSLTRRFSSVSIQLKSNVLSCNYRRWLTSDSRQGCSLLCM